MGGFTPLSETRQRRSQDDILLPNYVSGARNGKTPQTSPVKEKSCLVRSIDTLLKRLWSGFYSARVGWSVVVLGLHIFEACKLVEKGRSCAEEQISSYLIS